MLLPDKTVIGQANNINTNKYVVTMFVVRFNDICQSSLSVSLKRCLENILKRKLLEKKN